MPKINKYPVPVINHLDLQEELMALFIDTTINADQSLFCLVTFKQFICSNYHDEDIAIYFPSIYKRLFK